MADNILGFKFPPKPSKMAFYRHVKAATNGFKTKPLGGRAAYTIYSILEITAAVYFKLFTTQ